MGIEKLTERQIIGMFYKALSQDTGAAWLNSLTNLFQSDQASEEYAWLGQSPAMREWVGGRNAKGFRENSLTIRNKHFEATIEILVRDLRRDKSSQAALRIRELATRSNAHWASLITTLITDGESNTCYDGQYFFDTDHEEGDSGAQSNTISVDISALPAINHGTTTAPSVEEMQMAIALGVQQIVSFVDDQAEPMNEDASSFVVMVPIPYMNTALQAVATPAQVASSQTALQALKQNFSLTVVPNARLSWTEQFVMFRDDSVIKSFIRQEETGVSLKVKGYGSEYEFDNDAHQYGIDAWRNVGYGYWQNSCLVTLA
jgi:phage major head subunit gpT-like protein